ncbi:MAG TPA: hypothetical protein VFM56_04110 [Solimonas sp.]|nr:hypothetical protein [Solimonas sp.]
MNDDFDIQTLIARRRALGLIGAAASALVLGACGSSPDDGGSGASSGSGSDSGDSTSGTDDATTCSTYDTEETQGPYPADGTTSVNALNQSGINRSDIRTSFGSAGTDDAKGVSMQMTLTLVDYDNGCAPMAGYWIYIWHCDRSGNYSLYSSAAASENYLRGVQQTDSSGKVTFITYFPACYSGRWPHIHVEIYDATGTQPTSRTQNLLRTTQLCMPEDICDDVYETSLYSGSSANLARVSLDSDNVFGDNTAAQITLETPSFSGSAGDGYTAEATLVYSASRS